MFLFYHIVSAIDNRVNNQAVAKNSKEPAYEGLVFAGASESEGNRFAENVLVSDERGEAHEIYY